MKVIIIYILSPYSIKKNHHSHYLEFYIEANKQEILNNNPKRKYFTNISKEELNSLRSLAQDESIIINSINGKLFWIIIGIVGRHNM